MKIDSGTIGMESARSYKASSTTARRFRIRDYRDNQGRGAFSLNTSMGNQTEGAEDTEKKTSQERNIEREPKAASPLQEWRNRLGGVTRVATRTSAEQTYVDIREQTIRYIFDMLFAQRRGRLRQWVEEHVYEETEVTSFSTVGTVKTSDGREISFNVNVNMSRSFTEYYREELSLTAFSMCDPLVLNFDTDVAELKDQNFFFDIDGDGEEDEVAQLGSGSGYLALDKNDDGVINDGRELFGTSSGNGFRDLAAYDEDGNGWIDENDAVWDKLKIWVKDEKGKDILYRLADKGVGAICLQNVATDFALRGGGGKMLGNIRRTGVFLYENGNAGTVQHLDVAKYYKEA